MSEINKLFNKLFENDFSNFPIITYNNSKNEFVDEDEKNFYVTMDAPGFSKENLKIEIKNHILSIIGETKGKRIRNLYRTFSLPNTLKTDMIEATLVDGILTVTIPKIENRLNSRLIKIK